MKSDPHLYEETADELPPLSVGPASRRLKLRSGWGAVVGIVAALVILAVALIR